jgi:hypothetical protein
MLSAWSFKVEGRLANPGVYQLNVALLGRSLISLRHTMIQMVFYIRCAHHVVFGLDLVCFLPPCQKFVL